MKKMNLLDVLRSKNRKWTTTIDIQTTELTKRNLRRDTEQVYSLDICGRQAS